MEIQYGVLRNRDMDGHAFFYFKEATELIEQDESAQKKLGLLKEKIRKDGKYPVRNYNEIEALGEYILEDIWEQLEKDFPEAEIPDAHEQEKLNHLGFIANQRRFFVDFDRKAAELKSTLATTAKVLVFSPKGLGKSALLAHFTQHGFDEGAVIFYAVGASTQSTNLAQMAGFIAQELKQKYDISYQIPQKIENPGDLLSAFINAVPFQDKLLLIIDGADQLVTDSQNQRMQWMPDSLPDNVKFIISTSSTTQKELLKNRDFTEITINPAGPDAIRELTVNYLGFYSKQLPAKQLDLISNFPLAGNPLILFTLLNELRIFGVHEKLEEHIGTYTSNKNNQDFFAAFLQRLENDYGQPDFKLVNVLTSIYLANNGLTESEIVVINKVAKLRWSQIYNALDYHLINKSGKLSFANQSLGEAIEKRYLSSETLLNAQLKPLIDYFLVRFDSLTIENSAVELPRLMEELPGLALKSGDIEMLKKVMVNLPALLELFEKRNEELPHYLSVLKTQYKLPEILEQAVEVFLNENVDPGLKAKACFIAGHLLSAHDAPESAIPLLNKVLELFNHTRVKSPYVFEALKELATIYNQVGNYEAAAYILEHLLPYQQDENISEILDLLSQQYRNTGNQAIAEILIQDTIDFLSDKFGRNSLRVAIQYNNLGRLYDVGKNFELAEKNYAIAAQIVFDTLGPE
ncbi:MAG: NACHT domain-containing protein, partial [Lentimicrobium sp.]|nr:NACHT domain-containing protein [Lentimicrobium sp.]